MFEVVSSEMPAPIHCTIFIILQINSILNVGESAYSQIQKLKGQDDPQELNYKANVKVMIILIYVVMYLVVSLF